MWHGIDEWLLSIHCNRIAYCSISPSTILFWEFWLLLLFIYEKWFFVQLSRRYWLLYYTNVSSRSYGIGCMRTEYTTAYGVGKTVSFWCFDFVHSLHSTISKFNTFPSFPYNMSVVRFIRFHPHTQNRLPNERIEKFGHFIQIANLRFSANKKTRRREGGDRSIEFPDKVTEMTKISTHNNGNAFNVESLLLECLAAVAQWSEQKKKCQTDCPHAVHSKLWTRQFYDCE